jgi:two-component system cell cycle response regulator DivK
MSGRILYIEDNFDNRILIKRILEAEGYTVIEADDGITGIDVAKITNPDLILMDINLPDLDGYECTNRLRKIDGFAQIPIVALTANALEGDKQKAMSAGCDGYIPKPIDVDDLPNQIASHLNHKRSAESGSPSDKSSSPPAESNLPPAKSSSPSDKGNLPPAESGSPSDKSSSPPAESNLPPAKSGSPSDKSSSPPAESGSPLAESSSPPVKSNSSTVKSSPSTDNHR